MIEQELSSWVIVGGILGVLILGFTGASIWLWAALGAATLFACQASAMAWGILAAAVLLFAIPPIRRILITSWIMKIMKGFLPKISPTEKMALDAGDVWMESELFSGNPNFKKLLDQKYPELTTEEQAFLDGPTQKLCDMINDWDINQQRDLPPAAWEFIKKERFWGMIISKEYGGLGFSALAHSAVLEKMASRSSAACITIMVPNSLGPAELLSHYGTKAQKDHYLPRLARGEEVPCFALTEPHAGSDAASIQSNGVVFKGADGKLYLKLNWNKRWITLAAVSTVIGLAFRLKDPDNLLGMGVEPGITCALIPSNTPGVDLTRRHDPLGVPFYNCPTQGHDVVVPVDVIIGGPEKAGHGWQMLMECLAAGRGISLPAQSTVAAKLTARIASNHATVRKQFGMSIGRFEGIAEPLSRLAGFAYLLEAGRRYTLGALDSGVKPPVITAIMKYYFTEIQRTCINDAMDILGGAAITRGPKNLLASGYASTPISITVEGANILTRTLIIFGQGALRAHPYALKEVAAVDANDLKGFDQAFFGHIGHVIKNLIRSTVLTLTRGYLVIPYKGGVTAKYYRKLAWASASFAILADMAMGTMGAKLKTKGKTTGRFADILAGMYLASAALKRFEYEGRKKEDEPFLRWSLDYCFWKIQIAFEGLLMNFEAPVLGTLMKFVGFIWNLNPIGTAPSDDLEFKLADLIQTPGNQRARLTAGIHIPTSADDQLSKLEEAFRMTVASEEVSRKVRKAVKQGKLKKAPSSQLYKDAVAANVITQTEFENIEKSVKLADAAIQVDSFTLAEYFATALKK